MDQPVLQEVRIQGYRCLKDVRLKLTPLHALIGPNDSGKSSILQLIDGLKKYYPTLSNQHLWPKNHHLELTTIFGNVTFSGNSGHFHQQAKLPGAPQDPSWVARQARMVHLNAPALRAPGPLLPEGAATTFSDNEGSGLASIYDVLVNHKVDAFLAIQAKLRQLFPAIDRIGLVNISPTHKVMSATLKDGTRIRADEMSEGLLCYLAYAALPYLDPASVLLLEEPENGLHPARIREVMRILRELSKTTQILLTTHSPLVIDELAPEEVTIITRDPENGTQATPMKDTPNFAARQKVYTLGALWLSYADGDLEAPFVDPQATPQAWVLRSNS